LPSCLLGLPRAADSHRQPLRERRHRRLARWLIAARRRAIFVMPEGERQHLRTPDRRGSVAGLRSGCSSGTSPTSLRWPSRRHGGRSLSHGGWQRTEEARTPAPDWNLGQRSGCDEALKARNVPPTWLAWRKCTNEYCRGALSLAATSHQSSGPAYRRLPSANGKCLLNSFLNVGNKLLVA
jgi:hypothetical protein